LAIEVREFPQGTRTAEDAATAIGCDVAQIVKSLVFIVQAPGGVDSPVIALVGGADRVDERELAKVAGGTAARRASADEVRSATGYAVGGVPPFGHATPLRCFVDDALLAHDVVWAAAGTPTRVFACEPHALVATSGAAVARMRLLTEPDANMQP
jgi:prolyl-tRNA editing enzyme YbaK/EbsC (Cys-tRNA(Pro) deacylase)